MHSFVRLFCLIIFLTGFSFPAAALTEAGEAYVNPTLEELIEASIIFEGFDINAAPVSAEYIRMMYCDLYKQSYKDEFALNNIQKQVAARFNAKKGYPRTLFQISDKINFGQYDFGKQGFPITRSDGAGSYKNVGSMLLYSGTDPRPYCNIPDAMNSFSFPPLIFLDLGQPFTLNFFKIGQDAAMKIMDSMRRLKIDDRALYVRFRVRLLGMSSKNPRPPRAAAAMPNLNFSGEIIGIDLFYDKSMTMWMTSIPLTN